MEIGFRALEIFVKKNATEDLRNILLENLRLLNESISLLERENDLLWALMEEKE